MTTFEGSANDGENGARRPMPGLNANGRRVLSHGFALWKAKEVREGHSIPLRDIAAETGLSPETVRRFVGSDGSDISGVSVLAALVIAQYLGVGITELIGEMVEREK